MRRVISIKIHKMRMQSFPSGQHITTTEEEEGTAASPGTIRQVEHIVCIVNVVPPSTHCSHPAVICTHSLGFFSVAGSGYIFIYSTSLEAVIYDFNTQGDGCSFCPCGSGSGGVPALSFVVPFVANIQLLDGWLAEGLVVGTRFLEIFIIQFPVSVGNGRIHLCALRIDFLWTGSHKSATTRKDDDK